MRRFLPLRVLSLVLAVAVSGAFAPQSLSARDKKRTFRPIVPIKQNVVGGADKEISQSLSVAIPPPPIPESPAPSPSAALDQAPAAAPPGEADSPPDRSSTAAAAGDGSAEESAPQSETDASAPRKPDASDETPRSAAPESDPDADAPPAPAAPKKAVPGGKGEGPTLAQLREEAHRLAGMGLTYKFGASNPDTGGLDCSGAMQHLLSKLGVEGVPRTSYDQYYWLRRLKLLDDVHGRNAEQKLFKKLSPGDLIFWGGTWKSGHSVSHVMLYLGYDPNAKKHYVFGARGRNSTGKLGHGVDIFELDPNRGRLIAHGKIPGLRY